jgi:hypothetical protein
MGLDEFMFLVSESATLGLYQAAVSVWRVATGPACKSNRLCARNRFSAARKSSDPRSCSIASRP